MENQYVVATATVLVFLGLLELESGMTFCYQMALYLGERND